MSKKLLVKLGIVGIMCCGALSSVFAVADKHSVSFKNQYGIGSVTERASYSIATPYWSFDQLSCSHSSVATGYVYNGVKGTTAINNLDKAKRNYTVSYMSRANYTTVSASGGYMEWFK